MASFSGALLDRVGAHGVEGLIAAARAQVKDLFPDGYCDCRCGPQHHRVKLVETEDGGRLRSFCTYHDRVCAHEELPRLSRDAQRYLARDIADLHRGTR